MGDETYLNPEELDHLMESAGSTSYRRLALIIVIALGIIAAVCSQIPQVRGTWYRLVATQEPPSLAWRESFSLAVAEAADSHKPLLLFFADDSATSRVMLNEVWPHASIRSLGNSAFVPFRVSAANQDDLVRDFNITAMPTTLIIRDRDQQIRLTGYVSPDNLEFDLKRALN